ncbi:chromosome segregation protein SMC, partial [Oscillibacter sp. UBA6647]
ADARAEASAAAAERAQISERRTASETELTSVRERLNQTGGEAKTNRRALEDARDEAGAVTNIIAGHSMKMEERQRKADEAAQRANKLTMDAGALDSRIRLLTEMEKEYEGFSKAVRLVCQAQSSLRGIRGPVAGLMSVERKFSVAIEIALGAGLQNIVVDREEDAKAAIGFLKQRDAGRATFLPLSAIRGDELRENGLEREYGYVGLASGLVECDPQYAGIFRNLLGRTVVAEDLDCGIAMARKYGNRFRIVTLDGQVMNRGGSMTGGSVSRSAGVLSRAAELKELHGKAETMNRRLAEAKTEAEELNRELEKARYELETAQGQQRAAEDEVLRLEGRQSHFDILLQSLRASLETLEGECEALSGRLAECDSRGAKAAADIAAAEAEAAGLRAKADEQLSGQTELLARAGELSESVSARKSHLAALRAEREGAALRGEDLQALKNDLSGDRSIREETLDAGRAAIARAEEEIAARQARAQALHGQGQALRDRLGTLDREKIELEAERTAKSRAGQEMNEHLLDLERTASRLEQKMATGSLEEKQILDRLWEHYELSHSDAQAQRVELESRAKANRRIGELKREISALGTPNIGAIEEFDRVNTRYTYLSEQRDDVENAGGEIRGVIEELTREMTGIFSQQFKLLSESFQSTFVDLFGGGQATLELEDENDILNCGIEIKAQPPGKTLKTISLLSGGEKAFVAIALYFSILKVHPTPFCVMDEIEAALDDANVTRYARYMRTLAGKTQFIVITHRRGTMEEADVLYGVTMQEQGVSKILTINLNDMAKELNIK